MQIQCGLEIDILSFIHEVPEVKMWHPSFWIFGAFEASKFIVYAKEVTTGGGSSLHFLYLWSSALSLCTDFFGPDVFGTNSGNYK